MMAEMMRLQPSKVQFIHSYPQARDHGTGIEMCSLFIHERRRGTMAEGIAMCSLIIRLIIHVCRRGTMAAGIEMLII